MTSTVHYFEMTSREAFLATCIPAEFEMKKVREPSINERFYREVGADWEWTVRRKWTAEEWSIWVERDELETWLAYSKGEEAGYVELEVQDGGDVEIVYFGLLPSMIGKSLGGAMLTMAVTRAWEIEGTKRVWLHTCTEDHPHAVSNYEKRGFRLFKTEVVAKKNDEAN
jgi:GNAT superfamily N-acetyltransferase